MRHVLERPKIRTLLMTKLLRRHVAVVRHDLCEMLSGHFSLFGLDEAMRSLLAEPVILDYTIVSIDLSERRAECVRSTLMPFSRFLCQPRGSRVLQLRRIVSGRGSSRHCCTDTFSVLDVVAVALEIRRGRRTGSRCRQTKRDGVEKFG